MANPDVSMTLDEAVHEVLGLLTGLDLTYVPELDEYYAVTRALNRALRANALEVEWSYYSGSENVGTSCAGDRVLHLRRKIRPRKIGDDAVRLVDPKTGNSVVWAYFLPRESLHKYATREGLWASVTRDVLEFSRPLHRGEAGLDIIVPTMREPKMFELPPRPKTTEEPILEVPEEIQEQRLDFDYPDVVILRAAAYHAMTNPLMQPRVIALQEEATDLMYQLKERDESNTDAPYMNEFLVPIDNDIYGRANPLRHGHPHADARR